MRLLLFNINALQLFARQKKPSFTHARLLYRLSYQKSRGKFVKIACSRGFLRIFPIAALLYKSVFSSYYILIQLFSDIFFVRTCTRKNPALQAFRLHRLRRVASAIQKRNRLFAEMIFQTYSKADGLESPGTHHTVLVFPHSVHFPRARALFPLRSPCTRETYGCC